MMHQIGPTQSTRSSTGIRLLVALLALALAACGVPDQPPDAPPTPTQPATILWIDDCDPRSDPKHCQKAPSLKVFEPFYTAIRDTPATITYALPATIADLQRYDVVIANFCGSAGDPAIVAVLKRYLDAGGSVVAMGDNTCITGHTGPRSTAADNASTLTRAFGVTFTNHDEMRTRQADTIVDHPLTHDVRRIAAFRNAFLRVSGPAQTIMSMDGHPFLAVSEEVGTLVVIPSISFHYDVSGFLPDMAQNDNFVLWRNMLTWLSAQARSKRK